MIITCEVSCDMGYIYLKPPFKNLLINCESNISEFYKEIIPTIIYEKDENIATLLNCLAISNKTYSEALNNGDIDQEYQNDRDENGYITGVELDMSESKFVNLIKSNAYRIYSTNWRDKDFHMVTFNTREVVFGLDNIIYPLTKDNDSFIVVKIERKYNIGLIEALMTYRYDIYPIDYLKKPQFFLSGIYS